MCCQDPGQILGHLEAEKVDKPLIGTPSCYWTLTQKVLFIPGTTGPCSTCTFGLQLKGTCNQPTGAEVGCQPVYVRWDLYSLDSNCNPTFVQESMCELAIGWTACGATTGTAYA
jgi:hypothetical protein